MDFTEDYFSKKYSGNYSVFVSKYGIKFAAGNDKITLSDKMNPAVFLAYQKIVKNLDNLIIWDQIKDKLIRFNGYDNKLFLTNCDLSGCINIDIKGAYPSALKNLGLIDQEIYQFLLNLPKLDRLKAIGMTAKKNVEFNFADFEIVDFKPNESEYQNCYFAAAYEIECIMEQVKAISFDYFIFTWVDGIFLRPETPVEIIREVCRFLSELNYNYHVLQVDLKINRRGNVLDISVTKENDVKEYKFKDIYFKEMNNKINSKLLARYEQQQQRND